MQAETASVSCFGKLPTHGDFVRYHAGTRCVQAMDAWLQKGLYAAQARLNTDLKAAYDASAACFFLFSPRDAPHALCGVMRPSRDRSGRRYPFLVAYEVSRRVLEARRISQLPVASRGFLERAAQLVCDATAGRVGHHEVGNRLDDLQPPLADVSGPVPAYERYLEEMPLAAFAERLWGRFQDEQKYLFFKNLLDILLPLRGKVPHHFSLGLRFPLGSGELPDHDVSFWLETCLRLLDAPGLVPTCFWTVPEAQTGHRPFLLLFLQPPPAQAFAHLLPAVQESDRIYALDRMGGAQVASAASSIPAPYAALIESGQLSLRDFLHRL